MKFHHNHIFMKTMLKDSPVVTTEVCVYSRKLILEIMPPLNTAQFNHSNYR